LSPWKEAGRSPRKRVATRFVYNIYQRSISTLWVNSFMQSLLQKVSFYLCLCPMNNENKMILSAAVTA